MEPNEKTFWKYYGYRREDNEWDYKRDVSIRDKAEFAELAKDILAFSNFGGGHILLGIEDKTHILRGVENEIDPADLGNQIEGKLGHSIDVKTFYFDFTNKDDEGIRLGILFIPPATAFLIPAKSLNDSNSDLVVPEGTIYYRRKTSSLPANSADMDAIMNRLNNRVSTNTVAIAEDNEQSALARVGDRTYFDHLNVLANTYEPTSKAIGSKLREVWKTGTKYSKHDFANLLGIDLTKIDSVFDGNIGLELSQIIAATKMFDLPTDYFFRPTYDGRFAYWEEDLVRWAILSLVRPKSEISNIEGRGTFFYSILNELAKGICTLHDILYGQSQNGNTGETREPISDKLKSQLGHQYYKLLEQYPTDERRTNTQNEKILRQWFYAGDEYIARLIIEGIDFIKVKKGSSPIVQLKFFQDLHRRKVRSMGYDTKNLRMVKGKEPYRA